MNKYKFLTLLSILATPHAYASGTGENANTTASTSASSSAATSSSAGILFKRWYPLNQLETVKIKVYPIICSLFFK